MTMKITNLQWSGKPFWRECLVGDTSEGRVGLSFGEIRWAFQEKRILNGKILKHELCSKWKTGMTGGRRGEVNGGSWGYVICAVGAGRKEGGILWRLLIMIKILSLFWMKWVLFEHFDQNCCDMICVKESLCFLPAKVFECLQILGSVPSSRNAIQARLWWELWLPWWPLEPCSLWRKLHLVQKDQRLGLWAINALIFLLIHIPISSRGFPITKHNDKPEGRGARLMKPTEISFAGHRMEQKRWMVNLLEWRLSGTITIDILHNNRTMKSLWFIIFPAPKTMYNMAGFYTWQSNSSYPATQTPSLHRVSSRYRTNTISIWKLLDFSLLLLSFSTSSKTSVGGNRTDFCCVLTYSLTLICILLYTPWHAVE